MTADDFLPPGFRPPTSLATEQFRLEPLGPQHNEADQAAWMSSIEHIRSTPGYPDGNWPPLTGMTLEQNLADLRRHADDFARGAGFTFTVLDPGDNDVIGCVYVYPSDSEDWDVTVQSWVRADRSELDVPLADAVADWLATDWPWKRVNRYGRSPRPGRGSIQRMDNVAIVVDDLAAATAFFVALGLELEGEATVEGSAVDRLVRLEGVRSDIAMMRTPDGHGRLELTKYQSPSSRDGDPHAPANTLGMHRVMFAVEDMDDILDRLRPHGAELLGEVVEYENSYRLCYLRGPAGILVALAEQTA